METHAAAGATPLIPTLASSKSLRNLLLRELERRCRQNPRYSLRAFSKALSMSPAGLSLVLNGKRTLSRNAARRIADLVALPPEENAQFVEWSNLSLRERKTQTADARSHPMSLDSFALISEWYHLAILSLLEIPGARYEAAWIGRRLGIPEPQARAAMERLERLEMVGQVDGRWRQTKGPIRIGNNVPTAATAKHQRQILHKALESSENDAPETRNFSSYTIAMDPALVPYAREQIRKFRRALGEELEAKGNHKRVYQIAMQVFPISSEFENEVANESR